MERHQIRSFRLTRRCWSFRSPIVASQLAVKWRCELQPTPPFPPSSVPWRSSPVAVSATEQPNPTVSLRLPQTLTIASDLSNACLMVVTAKALTILQLQFKALSDWNGDPCLPANYSWDWVGCSSDPAPRIIAL